MPIGPRATAPTGLRALPAAVFAHVLGWAGSRDLGALAGVARLCRQSVVGHIRAAKAVTLDVCDTMFANGTLADDARRGCAIRGIRLVAAHLAAASHIQTRDAGPHGRASNVAHDTADAETDAAHTKRVVASTIARNVATLQTVDFEDGEWYECRPVMAALAECRRLTALDSGTPADRKWFRTALHTLVASNSGCMTKLVAGSMNSDTLSVALTRFALTDLRISLDMRLDATLLSKCTTLERLSIGDTMRCNRARLRAVFDALAHALPSLTRLQKLDMDTLCVDVVGMGTLPWRFAPSLTALELCSAHSEALPEMGGGSVATLQLSGCNAAIGVRLIRKFRATLRDVNIDPIKAGLRDFVADLPRLLDACPALECLRFGSALAPLEAMSLVRACPRLTLLHLLVDATFRPLDLGLLLVALHGPIRDLRVHYCERVEDAIVLDLRDSGDAKENKTHKREEKEIRLRLPQLLLPHLVSFDVEMCSDALLEKLECPQVTSLTLLGVRVRMRRPVPSPTAFPNLERLSLRISPAAPADMAETKVDAGKTHPRLRTLGLAWGRSNYRVQDAWAFRADVLCAILDRCPAATSLEFLCDTSATKLIAALAGPSRPQSRIVELTIRAKLESTSDELLSAVRALAARHPRLQSVSAPQPAALDPRIREALSAFSPF